MANFQCAILVSLIAVVGVDVGCLSANKAIRISQDGFSETDRLQSEQWLAAVQKEIIEANRIGNRVIREETVAKLQKSVRDLDGRMVTWTFPTVFTFDGGGIKVVAPSDFQKGIVYDVTTTDYWGFGLLVGEYEEAITPRLLLDSEIERDSFRKLQGGENVKVRGMIRVDPTGGINVIGRIIEDPFGNPVPLDAKLEPGSQWSGNAVFDQGQDYSLKITVTEKTGNSFSGRCENIRGGFSYSVQGTQAGKTVEFEIKPQPGSIENFPYLTTFKGEIADGFMLKGTLGDRPFTLFWDGAGETANSNK